jgi:type I restriction enzyme S subunit
MRLPRYKEYQDSGVAWLGHVPSHWQVDRIKASIATARNGIWGDEPQGNGDDIACVRVADFDRNKLQVKASIPTVRSVTAKERIGRLLNEGDLLLEKSGGGELQPVGQVVLYQLDVPAVCSNFVSRVTLKSGMCPGYWNYVHSAAYSVGVNIGSINQTSGIQNLDQERYFNEWAPFPPYPEQSAIAVFLDRETAKIDALIEAQAKLSALLVENRQATISQAVTKGINPNAPMKDSGITWLGSVPAHWEIICIRYLVDAIGDVDHFMPVSVEKGIPYLMTGDLKEFLSDVSLGECKQVSHNDYVELSKRIKSSKGDVILARYATIGTSMYVDIDVDFLVSYSCVTLKTKNFKLSGLYLFQYTKSDAFRQGVENQINTNTQSNVGIRDLQNVKIAIPPINEQASITAFLETATTKFDVLKAESERAINLLKERRSALIAAAVTGQIDVRGTTPQTADEGPEAIAA